MEQEQKPDKGNFRAMFAILRKAGCPMNPSSERIAWMNGWRRAYNLPPIESTKDLNAHEVAFIARELSPEEW